MSKIRQNYHEDCEALINKQINMEFYASYVYQLSWQGLLLRLNNANVIRQGDAGSVLAGGVPWQHNLNLDAKHTLSEVDVSDGIIYVVLSGLTRVDHETVSELHALGTLTTQLAADNHFATLGTRLHDETEDTIAGPSHSKTTNKLVTEGLSLGDGAKATLGNLLSIQLNGALRKAKTLLDQRGQLPDAATLFTKDVLGPGGENDDLCAGGSVADLHTGVAIFSQLIGEEAVQLSAEHAVLDELFLFVDRSR